MADDLAAQLAALKEAYRSGVNSVSYAWKSVTYHSAAEMREAIASLEDEIAGGSRKRNVVVRSNKGW